MIGYVTSEKVGLIYVNGIWDNFKRYVTNQGYPLEYTSNWFQRSGGVLDQLKAMATDSATNDQMKEFINGFYLQGGESRTIKRSDGTSMTYSCSGTRAYVKMKPNSPRFNPFRTSGYSTDPSKGGSTQPNGYNQIGVQYYNLYNTNYNNMSGIKTISPNSCSWSQDSRGPIPCFNLQCNTPTGKINSVYGTMSINPDQNSWYYGGGNDLVRNLNVRCDDGTDRYTQSLWTVPQVLPKNTDVAFDFTCPYGTYIDTWNVNAPFSLQVSCSDTSVYLGTIDDNHIGQIRTPNGDWVPIGLMFTLIGNCPKATSTEGFAWYDTFVNVGQSGWDLLNTGIGFIKDGAGNTFNNIKDFCTSSANSVSNWVTSDFVQWAKAAGQTFIATMVYVGNNLSSLAVKAYKWMGANIGSPISNAINDAKNGINMCINVLSDIAEIAQDTFSKVIRFLSSNLSSMWKLLKDLVGYMVTKALNGRQCMFLKYAKTDSYKALRYLVFLLANPIYMTVNTVTNTNKGASYVSTGKPEKVQRLKQKKVIYPGIRQPIKNIVENLIRATLALIPILGPVIIAVVQILKWPPMVWWVDWKIDREVFIPMFDYKRDDVLMIVTPVIDNTGAWTCNWAGDLKDYISNKIKDSFQSKIDNMNANVDGNVTNQAIGV